MLNIPKFNSPYECKVWTNKHNPKIKKGLYTSYVKHSNFRNKGTKVLFVCNYVKDCYNLLDKLGIEIEIEFLYLGPYFEEDKLKNSYRNVYSFTIKYKNKKYTGKFGNSIDSTGKKEFPNCYSIISCLTKYNPESLENFCCEFGCNINDKNTRKLYDKVQSEYNGLLRVLGKDNLEKLSEIS